MVDDIIDNDFDEIEIVEFGIPRRIYIRSNHFDHLDDATFFKKFRLTKESVQFVLSLIEDEIKYPVEM